MAEEKTDEKTRASRRRKSAAPRKSRISLPFGRAPLNGIAEIRTFFRTNQQPIYFVGPTAFNLLGIDRWVRNFQYIVYYDSWDGAHPRVFTPKNKPYVEFESSEHVNNYLLRDPRCRRTWTGAAARRWSRWSSSTRRPRRSARNRATT